MQGVTILYGLFARDLDEMDRARSEQLEVRRPSGDSLYPSYMWTTMTDSQQEQWIDDEAKRYDRFNRLVSMTVLSLRADQLNLEFLNNADNACTVHRDDTEEALLAYIWSGLEESMRHQYSICGWKIREVLWPRLVNRSLMLGVKIPAWAKPDLAKKWFDVQLHDLSTIYSCGVWGRARPLPPIHYAMKFWLGRDFVTEEDVQLKAEINPNDEAITEATCDYAFGMGEVLYRYAQ